jgi:hypothetical protein
LQQGYGRYPIRKRYQMLDSMLALLTNHIDTKEIELSSMLNFAVLINRDYLIEPNRQKARNLLEIYGK